MTTMVINNVIIKNILSEEVKGGKKSFSKSVWFPFTWKMIIFPSNSLCKSTEVTEVADNIHFDIYCCILKHLRFPISRLRK